MTWNISIISPTCKEHFCENILTLFQQFLRIRFLKYFPALASRVLHRSIFLRNLKEDQPRNINVRFGLFWLIDLVQNVIWKTMMMDRQTIDSPLSQQLILRHFVLSWAKSINQNLHRMEFYCKHGSQKYKLFKSRPQYFQYLIRSQIIKTAQKLWFNAIYWYTSLAISIITVNLCTKWYYFSPIVSVTIIKQVMHLYCKLNQGIIIQSLSTCSVAQLVEKHIIYVIRYIRLTMHCHIYQSIYSNTSIYYLLCRFS